VYRLRQKIHPRKICHLRGQEARASACIVDVTDTFSNSLQRIHSNLTPASTLPLNEMPGPVVDPGIRKFYPAGAV